ncbi:orotate phosphoribosyltransferase [Pelagirhabdus alkalitolerans]|uniref:Orotate phosphoribosyltransferase n=1 Tax=Pelagirhabdus alkalitolerans TaxID=1612202 RepID=A0A1G6H1B8_9BACI|nr:orotate phosphoribosyltransferase [Pelagirhabdus alkalitolerans]SDB87938.1 orotate phosphoribosyltransferase [Pelagirhabdus alkalitolerans]
MSLSNQIIAHLYEIDAIQIKADRSFTWTSGIKSPIYCDNRLTMSYPDIRTRIVDGFVDRLLVEAENIDCIAGCATAGIPHAAWLSERLNLPMAYVRGKPKGHGKQNQIEGVIKKGERVLVIEDLISTGQSVFETIDAIEKVGAHVIGVQAIFSYGLPRSKQDFDQRDIRFDTLANFDQLVTLLLKNEEITDEEADSLIEWRDQINL